MPQLNANLTLLYNEVPFLERFGRAARSGFKAVEYLFPYPFPKDAIGEQLSKHGLKQILFDLPGGDWDGGERGIATDPKRVGEFQDGVGLALDYAAALGATMLTCIVGKNPPGVDRSTVESTLVDNLRFAARALDDAGVKLLVEPLNNLDNPDFHLVHTEQALKLFDAVGHTNCWLQYDIYHMQVMEGDLIRTIRRNLSRIRHMQLADNPGRHEPGTGEIHFANLFRAIDEAGYTGWIGCEYRPLGRTEDGLGWIKPYLR